MRRKVQLHPATALESVRARGGFTLLEVLIALTITLILMTLIVRVFQITSDGIFNARANMEMSDQLRNAKHRLIQDLRGTTALTIPPIEHTWATGYFEYHEGQSVAVTPGGDLGFRPTGTVGVHGSVPVFFTEYGDRDDILMFTTASFDEQFVGRVLIGGQPRGVRSRFAEVAWYPHVIEDAANATQRMLTLRRRLWLLTTIGVSNNARYDSSTRNSFGAGSTTQWQRATSPLTATNTSYGGAIVGNTLESLSKREYRMHHEASPPQTNLGGYTHPLTHHRILTAVRGIVAGTTSTGYQHATAPFDFTSLTLQTVTEQDATSGGIDRREDNFSTAPQSRTIREAEDIILSNIVGFDVKAWDPGAPVFRVVADAENPELVGVVQPGDPGYVAAVHRFITGPGNPQNQPVSFGAYGDLNYMGALASQSTYTFAMTSTSFPLNRYRQALGTMATTVTGKFQLPYFAGPGELASKLSATGQNPSTSWSPAIYDTFSRHYEYDGVGSITTTTGGTNVVPAYKRLHYYTNTQSIDAGMNGIDDNGNGLIDEPMERDAVPPYEKPLRGIRVSIRAMEPNSKKVREITVVHEFVPL